MDGHRLMMAAWLLAFTLAGPAASSPADPTGAEVVSAELVADAGTVRAGQAFTLGVRLRLADGWHVYWKNPGASGLPTEVRFRLPVGFSAGPIQWPLPVRFRQPDGEECYGYEREVLLAARIQAPPGLREGAILEFGAESRWLACRELCRLGRADLRLALPVSAEITKGDGGFDRWRDLLPAGAGEAGRWVDARLQGAPGGAGDAGTYQLDLVWIQAARVVEWYPVTPETLDISDVRLAGDGTRWKLRFTARELAGQRWEGDTLDSLLLFVDASGRRRGIELPLRLRGEPQGGKASH